jgi:hypothetical protein
MNDMYTVLFSDFRGDWTAHKTPFGYLVRSPYGEPLSVVASLNQATEEALRAKEVYDEVDRVLNEEYRPLSLEELAEEELGEDMPLAEFLKKLLEDDDPDAPF